MDSPNESPTHMWIDCDAGCDDAQGDPDPDGEISTPRGPSEIQYESPLMIHSLQIRVEYVMGIAFLEWCCKLPYGHIPST